MLSQVGKYQILEKIGVGGFGAVYKGRDPFIKRAVAIKTCQSDEEEIKKRFFREAEYAGNLHHPNVTTIYDFGVTDEGVPYIVQEFLTGEDLDKKIKRRDPIDTRERLRFLSEICDGLGYAHAAGIVHRDIKPANIRVLEDGTVKIMDFGIAKSMVSESTLTQTGITLGTASYLAPEQIKGEPVDQRTDIFSLGVLCYELFSLQKPFTGDHISTVLYKILHEAPPPPSELLPGLPPSLDALIFSMLEKDRTKRPASCAEIRDEIRRILAVLDGSPAGAPILPGASPSGPDSPTTATPSGGVHTPRPSASGPSGPSAPVAFPPLPPTPSGGVEQVELDQPGGRAPVDEGGGALKVFLAAIVVLVLGGIVLWATLYRAGGRRSLVPATPVAADSTPTPATPSTAAPATASTSAAGPTAPASPASGPSAPGATAAAPPAQAAAQAPTPPPVTTGAAFFRPTLVSELTLDGKRRGPVSPSGMRIGSLSPGPHRAVFGVKDFMSIDRAFEVRAGETVEVRADFPQRGMLSITLGSPEWSGAEVLVDGQSAGTAPLKKPLAAGTHRVEVRLPGFEPFVRSVEVVPDDLVRVAVDLVRK